MAGKMKKGNWGIWLILMVCLALVSRVWATIITIEVEGVVDGVWTEGDLVLDGSVTAGSTMSGYGTYDTETPDQEPADYSGLYSLMSISTTIGNYTFSHNPDSPNPALFKIQSGGDFFYNTESSNSLFDGLIYLDGLPKNYEDITWDDTYLRPIDVRGLGDVLPNDDLPTVDTFPGLSVFDWQRSFDVLFRDNSNNYFLIYGEITSLAVVPEPGTILLLGLGGVILLRRRRS